MAIISVDVPDKIAARIKPFTVVSLDVLYDIEDEEGEWVSYPVNLPADEFQRKLQKIINKKSDGRTMAKADRKGATPKARAS